MSLLQPRQDAGHSVLLRAIRTTYDECRVHCYTGAIRPRLSMERGARPLLRCQGALMTQL
eukprot:CAMPEP_0115174602 /NCGR_PEP_ID=MMETSP0270-20121206/3923_1 /TAXON_ID=71861 /ORGANISM="Scrippsiella trochoidea, Strain CCMP3099" /LENGTH=59 /DNA_ID=CAMNT_0002587445 /DNA_START=275 /DNA_END=454 /DNA_ORIENTATION=+